MAGLRLNPQKYLLSKDEHEHIFKERIIPDLFSHVKSVTHPKAIIFGGQPGSGKSAAVHFATLELQNHGGAILISGDDFRNYHPAYQTLLQKDDKIAAFYTDIDSGQWVEKSIEYAKNNQCNIVIEGTMRVADRVAKTMLSLKQSGYFIEARALAVNEKLSWQGVLDRYESQKATPRAIGRMTTQEAHIQGYNGIPKTLQRIEQDRLADSIKLYTRGNHLLYENHLINGTWSNPLPSNTALNDERERNWTLPERVSYLKGYERILTMIKHPERAATTEEIKYIESLKDNALEMLQSDKNHAKPAPAHLTREEKYEQIISKYMNLEQTYYSDPFKSPASKENLENYAEKMYRCSKLMAYIKKNHPKIEKGIESLTKTKNQHQGIDIDLG